MLSNVDSVPHERMTWKNDLDFVHVRVHVRVDGENIYKTGFPDPDEPGRVWKKNYLYKTI